MVVIGLVLTGFAAVFHVYAFVLESLVWTTPRARAVFGTTAEQAEQTRQLAFNQGFYNLFLAVGVAVGTVLIAAGHDAGGTAVVVTSALVMVGAGLVLALSDRRKARAGLLQAVPPAVGVVLLLVGYAG